MAVYQKCLGNCILDVRQSFTKLSFCLCCLQLLERLFCGANLFGNLDYFVENPIFLAFNNAPVVNESSNSETLILATPAFQEQFSIRTN